MAATYFPRLLPGVATILGFGVWIGSNPLEASEGRIIPAAHPWNHRLPWQAFDHASVRRGFMVYKEVCATCHSLNLLAYRNLVDAVLTKSEAEALAADVEVTDGPDETGEMFTRPGKLFDYLVKPYANDNAARFANNGALPPDLSLIVKSRPYREDYIFSILTGYKEAPVGVNLRQGLYYNPYFPGSAIAMPPPLINGMVEYEDGTEATVSQMGKDVTTFLYWAAEPLHDDRKRAWVKTSLFFGLPIISGYWYRWIWTHVKNRKIRFTKL